MDWRIKFMICLRVQIRWYILIEKCRTQFMLPMEKSVTFTGVCANEIIPSINRSCVYKAKEGRHVRIVIITAVSMIQEYKQISMASKY